MALFDTLTKRFALPLQSATGDERQALAGAANQIAVYKQQALETARQSAFQRASAMEQTLGRPLNDSEIKLNGMPTLEDYRIACENFAQTPQGRQLAENGQWNARIYSDLGGQNITGFRISEPQQQDKTAVTDLNLHDRDGDGAVNDFYANVDFNGATIKDCIVDPATSFNDEIAKAKTVENITFNNMKTGDVFTFGSGQYKDIELTNINGGEIKFSEGTQVEGIDIRGLQASITIDKKASVSQIKVDDRTRILTLEMAEGAVISHSDLREATISMASKMQGAVIRHVKFGGNLTDVDMRGVKLSHVSFDQVSANNLDLRGAELQNVMVNGKAVTDTQQLVDLGIRVDATTKIHASKELKVQRQVEAIARNMSWAQDIPTAPSPAAAAPAIEAPKIAPQAPNGATAGITEAKPGFNGSYTEFMNADLTKAPKQEAPSPALSEAEATLAAFRKATEHVKAPAREDEGAGAAVSMMAKVQPKQAPALPPRRA